MGFSVLDLHHRRGVALFDGQHGPELMIPQLYGIDSPRAFTPKLLVAMSAVEGAGNWTWFAGAALVQRILGGPASRMR